MWEFWRSRNSKKKQVSLKESLNIRKSQSLSSPTGQTRGSKFVNFKDLNVAVEETDETEEDESSYDHRRGVIPSSVKKMVTRNKLIIILVGLPGRGKTFLANKLKAYLNWLGHQTKIFNVGQYRRLQNVSGETQDADFFDPQNRKGLEARQKALLTALDDLIKEMESDHGQVAIFDATNTTEERRSFLISQFHGRFQYMFIESICNDEQILEQNYQYKMMYSPDYTGVGTTEALEDFKQRIKKYQLVYQPINSRSIHYIKLIDMVTGRGHMDVNRISGYLPSKIVFFLMQVCKAGFTHIRKIWLTRHGESEYNCQGRIGGDPVLSAKGSEYARLLPDVLIDRLPLTMDDNPVPISVWTSTLKRTIHTAGLLPFPKLRWKALDEIHAGICEHLTYEEINEKFPEEFSARQADKLRYRYPAGESYLDVIQRLEPVIIEMEREMECICVVGHQAILRVIYGYLMQVPIEQIPMLSIPIHQLIELTPMPDGTLKEERIEINVGEVTIAADTNGVQYRVQQFTDSPKSAIPEIPMMTLSKTPSLATLQAFGADHRPAFASRNLSQRLATPEKDQDIRSIKSAPLAD